MVSHLFLIIIFTIILVVIVIAALIQKGRSVKALYQEDAFDEEGAWHQEQRPGVG